MKPLVRNLVVPIGEWKGHPNGEERVDAETARAIVAHFQRTHKAYNKPIVIDFEHQSLKKEKAPAAGWIWDLLVDEEAEVPGVYMLNEWVGDAEDLVRQKKYRYISPVLASGKDPVTGESIPMFLLNAGLTNMPFMYDKMIELAASNLPADIILNKLSFDIDTITIKANAMDPLQIIAEVKKALQMKPEATDEEMLDLITKLTELKSLMPQSQEGGGAGGAGMPPAEMAAQMKRTIETLHGIETLIGKKDADLMAELTVLKNSQTPPDEADKVKNLETEVARMKAERLIAENENRIPVVDREFWTNTAVRDYDFAKEAISKLPVILQNTTTALPNKPKTSEEAWDPEQARVCAMLGVSKDDFLKHHTAEVK